MALRLKIKLGGKFVDQKRPSKRTGAQQTTGAVAQGADFAVRADDSGADELPADLKAFLARDLQRCTSPLGTWVDEAFALTGGPPNRTAPPPQLHACLPALHRHSEEKLPHALIQGQQDRGQHPGVQQPAFLPPLHAAAAADAKGGGHDPWQQSQTPGEGRSSEACSTQELAAAMLNAGSPDSISSASLSPAPLLLPQPRLDAASGMKPNMHQPSALANAAPPQHIHISPQSKPQMAAHPSHERGDGDDVPVKQQQRQRTSLHDSSQRRSEPAQRAVSPAAPSTVVPHPITQQSPAYQGPDVHHQKAQPRSRGPSSDGPSTVVAASSSAPSAAAPSRLPPSSRSISRDGAAAHPHKAATLMHNSRSPSPCPTVLPAQASPAPVAPSPAAPSAKRKSCEQATAAPGRDAKDARDLSKLGGAGGAAVASALSAKQRQQLGVGGGGSGGRSRSASPAVVLEDCDPFAEAAAKTAADKVRAAARRRQQKEREERLQRQADEQQRLRREQQAQDARKAAKVAAAEHAAAMAAAATAEAARGRAKASAAARKDAAASAGKASPAGKRQRSASPAPARLPVGPQQKALKPHRAASPALSAGRASPQLPRAASPAPLQGSVAAAGGFTAPGPPRPLPRPGSPAVPQRPPQPPVAYKKSPLSASAPPPKKSTMLPLSAYGVSSSAPRGRPAGADSTVPVRRSPLSNPVSPSLPLDKASPAGAASASPSPAATPPSSGASASSATTSFKASPPQSAPRKSTPHDALKAARDAASARELAAAAKAAGAVARLAKSAGITEVQAAGTPADGFGPGIWHGFREGQVVWAKQPGSPALPAQVTDPGAEPETAAAASRDPAVKRPVFVALLVDPLHHIWLPDGRLSGWADDYRARSRDPDQRMQDSLFSAWWLIGGDDLVAKMLPGS